MKKFIKIISTIILICSILYIFYWFNENKKTSNIIKESYQYTYVEYNNPKFTDEIKKYTNTNSDYANKKINFEKLSKTYSNAIAWIYINNTKIDFPIVKTDNNSFYLNHSINGKYNSAGWPFLDYRNSVDILSTNTTIYGHNRLNDSMFGTLSNCLKKEWYENKENQNIIFTTRKNTYIFKIFSIYETPAESYFATPYFDSIKKHDDFLNKILSRSIYDFKEKVTATDKILTVSTCSNNLKDRIVVHGKLIKILEN